MTVSDMPMRELTLLPASEEEFARLKELAPLRAVGLSQTKLFAYASGTSDANAAAAFSACGADQDCLHYFLLLLGRVGPSELLAREINIKVFLRLARGTVSQYRDIYRGVECNSEDVEVAGAYLVGNSEFELLVEITGDDPGLVVTARLRLTDPDSVEPKDVPPFTQPPAERTGTAPY